MKCVWNSANVPTKYNCETWTINGKYLYFPAGNTVSGLIISGGDGHDIQATPGLAHLNIFGEMTRVLGTYMYVQISGIPFFMSSVFFPRPPVASVDGL